MPLSAAASRATASICDFASSVCLDSACCWLACCITSAFSAFCVASDEEVFSPCSMLCVTLSTTAPSFDMSASFCSWVTLLPSAMASFICRSSAPLAGVSALCAE